MSWIYRRLTHAWVTCFPLTACRRDGNLGQYCRPGDELLLTANYARQAADLPHLAFLLTWAVILQALICISWLFPLFVSLFTDLFINCLHVVLSFCLANSHSLSILRVCSGSYISHVLYVILLSVLNVSRYACLFVCLYFSLYFSLYVSLYISMYPCL